MNGRAGTKNWTNRRVPLIADARAPLERIREKRADEPATAKVFRVREAQKSIDNTAKKLGIMRIVHHDLRHLFATACIEAGINIPTIAHWLREYIWLLRWTLAPEPFDLYRTGFVGGLA